MSRIRKYTLDISKWRSGWPMKTDVITSDEGFLGKGITDMLNCEGYMCCLGQFALQAGVNLADLYSNTGPAELANQLGEVYDENFAIWNGALGLHVLTSLAEELIDINDNARLSLLERIERIKLTLLEEGIALEVIEPEDYSTLIMKDPKV